MRNKIDDMCYTEFIEHLNKSGIKFLEREDVDIDGWFAVYVEVKPLSNKLKTRFFDADGGIQLFN